jgi:hypothetical protein
MKPSKGLHNQVVKIVVPYSLAPVFRDGTLVTSFLVTSVRRSINYLCTYVLYDLVRNAFDAGSIHYAGKWEGVGPWKSRVL